MNKIDFKKFLPFKSFFEKHKAFFASVDKFFMHLSLTERIAFIKQLSVLVKSGVPLFSSLHMLKEQSKSKAINKIMDQVIYDVENGQYLSTSFGKFKRIFGELTISIIAIGEMSGTLSDNLNHLVVTLKKEQALRRKVIGASVYPLFIVVATLVITVMLTVFFFPKIIPILQSVSYDLPWSTRTLIFVSDALRNYGLYIFLGLVAIGTAMYFLFKIKKVNLWYQKALLSLPMMKTFVQTYNMANICRTIGLLLNSSITVVRSFEITANTTTNVLYKNELNRISEKLVEGEKISTEMALKKKMFPVIVSQMISVGESTGKLSEIFLYLAEIYEDEMDDMTKNLSTTIEPLLLIMMGLLVGFIAISIITPIYGITQNLSM